jgi:tetratricopeptide (TPR) repeat protein
MTRQPKSDPAFEISFFESVHRRCPGYVEVIELLGGLYTKTGRIADGLKMDRKLVRLQPENATARYNLACSLALSERPVDALEALRQAVDLGYTDYEWMRQDPDLKPIAHDPSFQEILLEVKAASRKGSGKKKKR